VGILIFAFLFFRKRQISGFYIAAMTHFLAFFMTLENGKWKGGWIYSKKRGDFARKRDM